MTKLPIALTASFLALTAFFGSGAEAGFVRLAAPSGHSLVEKAGCGGGGGYFRSYHRKRVYRSVRRSVPHKVTVARKQAAEPVSVAKADEPETSTEATVAVSENSSIATGAAKVAAAASAPGAVKQVVAAKEVGCKQFFPAVGMTLSVACD